MSTAAAHPPPLVDVRVVHLASLGPGSHAAMMLADLGAEVIVVDRVAAFETSSPPHADPRRRGQRSLAVDLKTPQGREVVRSLVAGSDVLIEGMRPGVAERLGLGPEPCIQANSRLVYARVTGWGQSGPRASTAGHDINYVALTGALHSIGPGDDVPVPPLNLLGDYAGGGLYLAYAVLAALLERHHSGKGQVLDIAISDGVASLTASILGMLSSGLWGPRGTNAFDGSRPWYRTYRTRDGRYVAVGAIEDRFYSTLLEGLGLVPADWPRQTSADCRRLEQELANRFASQDRDHWEALFGGTDACVTPVLDFLEATTDPHNAQRGTYQTLGGVAQPRPLPRMSRTSLQRPTPPPEVGRDTDEILAGLEYSVTEVNDMRSSRVVA